MRLSIVDRAVRRVLIAGRTMLSKGERDAPPAPSTGQFLKGHTPAARSLAALALSRARVSPSGSTFFSSQAR